MTAITLQPHAMQKALLSFGTDNYEAVVSSADLVPTTPSLQFKGIGQGSAVTVTGTPTWVLNLVFAQDVKTAKSLTNFLNANVGIPKDATLTPDAGGPSWKVNVIPLAVNIGGAVDALATSTTAMPVNGQPQITAAAA